MTVRQLATPLSDVDSHFQNSRPHLLEKSKFGLIQSMYEKNQFDIWRRLKLELRLVYKKDINEINSRRDDEYTLEGLSLLSRSKMRVADFLRGRERFESDPLS